MCVTIGTAVAIGSIAASTAGSVYAAKKGSDAAHDAAKTQSDAAEKALQAQQQSYQQQRQDFQPYAQAGQASLGRLNSLATQPRPVFNGSQPGGGFQSPPQGAGMPQMGTMPGSMGQPGPMAQMSQQPPQGGIGGQALLAAQGAVGGQGGPQMRKMALMQAPDGTTKEIPEDQAQHYIQNGARRIG